MGVDSLPKTVTRQRRGCDFNPGPTAPESSTLTTRLPSHPNTAYTDGESSGRAGLHSAGGGDLAVLRTAMELGKRSFHVAVIWNSLPEHLPSTCMSKGQFRCGLSLSAGV